MPTHNTQYSQITDTVCCNLQCKSIQCKFKCGSQLPSPLHLQCIPAAKVSVRHTWYARLTCMVGELHRINGVHLKSKHLYDVANWAHVNCQHGVRSFSKTAPQSAQQTSSDMQKHIQKHLEWKGCAFVPHIAVYDVTLYRENTVRIGGHFGHVPQFI